jgi:sugar lactone lactonase YvrE
MNMPSRARRVAASAVLVTLAGTAISTNAQAQEPPWDVVATGLDSPRHLTFSASGALFVAESGRGGDVSCATHPQLGEFCLGFSGAVTRVRDRGPETQVLTGLPSIFNEEAGEALGPSDIAITGNNKFVLSIGLGGSDEFREDFGDDGALLATLLSGRLQRDRSALFADVLANEAAANPDGTDIDSNPVGILRSRQGHFIADAGGNAIVHVSRGGTFTTIAALPPTPIGADAVPTSVVKGPDGAFYVSQLTGFPFQMGAANIWRVVPGQAPTVYASGLTNLTDLAFARDGSLYAVEISTEGLLTGPIGSLKRITPGSSSHETIAGGLFAPYGVALARKAAYVSTCAVCTGGGEVIRIPLD